MLFIMEVVIHKSLRCILACWLGSVSGGTAELVLK